MRSIGPDIKTRTITYDTCDAPPAAGEFLVSVVKDRQPGTVYQVCSCRKVKSEIHPCRYSLQLLRRPELKQETRISFRFHVTVKDNTVKAHPLFWDSRKKKKS